MTTPGAPPAPRRAGLTILEALILIAILGAIAWFIYRRHNPPRDTSSRALCSMKLHGLFRALPAYLNSADDYFPLAWRVDGPSVAEDLGNLTFHRFALHECLDADFGHAVSQRDLQRNGGDPLAARQEKYRLTATLWKCPVEGWTDDYFATDLVFRTAGGPAHFDDLARAVPPSDRPLLADVNASLPHPEAKDLKDPGHGAEAKNGFSTVSESSMDIFVGVGPSLRVRNVPTSTRFDFRHEGSVNVLFLDGRVESIKSTGPKLPGIHRHWNELGPPPPQ